MSIGPFQILIIALIILVLFGRGRVSQSMGEFGEGIRNFKKGLADEPAKLEGQSAAPAEAPAERRSSD